MKFMKDFNIKPGSTCFVDTNIWLYSFVQSDKTTIAKNIIESCDIVISTQVINEMCVNLIKKMDFSEENISNLISSLYKRYPVSELTHEILLNASTIRERHSFSFWDSIIASSALDSDAEYLISEDMQNGFNLQDKLTIINPFQ